MRIIPSQPTQRLNLHHGFQHISMSTRKFQLHQKPFKHKSIDDSPLTVQQKHKTVKLAMISSSSLNQPLAKAGFEPATTWLQAMRATHCATFKVSTPI